MPKPKKSAPFVPAVLCGKCGFQALSDSDYDRQLSRPDSLWKCPRCGMSAEWAGNE